MFMNSMMPTVDYYLESSNQAGRGERHPQQVVLPPQMLPLKVTQHDDHQDHSDDIDDNDDH